MYLKLFLKLFFKIVFDVPKKLKFLQNPSEHDNKCIIFVDFFYYKTHIDEYDHAREESTDFTHVLESNNFHFFNTLKKL
jgi:hypothetical protein